MTFEEKLESLYNNTVPLIKPEELKKNSNTILLDTRSAEEFQVSHLKGAKLIDYKSFDLNDMKNISKDAEIVVYCSVGYRSERIGEKLRENGYTNVKNLYGGIFQWKNSDLEVVNMLDLPTDSVHTYNKRWSQWLQKGVKVYD